MRLLLGTHILVWWMSGEGELSPRQREALSKAERAGELLSIAAVSLWELAVLGQRGRIVFQEGIDRFFAILETHPGLAVLPLTPGIALESTRLGGDFPADPADRLIAATARIRGLPLVTADRRIRRSKVVPVI